MNNSVEYSAPHLRSNENELLISLDFFIAALPVIVWSVIAYGARPIGIMLLSTLSAALFELTFACVLHKRVKIFTAAMLGLIVSFFMPATISYWWVPLAALIAAAALRFTKGVLNPIAAALLPLFLFGNEMKAFTGVYHKLELGVFTYAGSVEDMAVTLPVKTLSPETTPAASAFDVFLGNSPESLGGLSAALLLIGCGYLIMRGVISWRIPVGFIGGAAVMWYLLMFDGINYEYAVYHLCSGGIILAAVFGATEYSSSPVVPFGRLVHGAGCGVLAMIFRSLGLYTEGVLLAMLIMSALSRVIDLVTAERYFGYRTKKLGERFGGFLPKKKNADD